MNNNTKKLENTLKLYLRNNNLKELKSLLDNISDKHSYLYLYFTGLYNLQINQHHDAIANLKEAYNSDNTSLLPLYNISIAYIRSFKYQECIDYFNNYKKIINNDALLLSNIALCLHNLNNNADASKYFLQSLKIDPDNENICYNYAVFLYDINEVDKAIDILKKLYYKNRNILIGLNLTKYLSQQNNKLLSMEIAKELFENNSNNIDVLINYSEILRINKKYKMAVDLLLNNKTQTESFDYFNELAKAYYDNNDLINTSLNYKKCLSIDSDNKIILQDLAIISAKQSHFEESLNYCLTALNHDPENESIHQLVIENLYKIGNFDNFIKESIKFEKKYPYNQINNALRTLLSYDHNINNSSLFCSSPFDNIKVYKFNDTDRKVNLLKGLRDLAFDMNIIDEPNKVATIKGVHTDFTVFDNQNKFSLELEQFIHSCISDYKLSYTNKNDKLITDWPDNYFINGWCVILREGGYEAPHIHPNAWLSGCFYIDIPQNISNNKGNIEFITYGYDIPHINNNLPCYSYKPENGSCILFPSSLFHYTVPFNGKSDRISLAFDIIPVT